MSGKDAWIRAGNAALGAGGLDAVRVEALARDLDVTKGSFYWHFADRAALLSAMLATWESSALQVLEAAAALPTAEVRVGALMRSLARPAAGPPDAEVFAWARRDREVAERVAVVERARVVFLKEQLSALGAPLMEAHRRAESGYLAAVAWLDRAARTPWMKSDYGAFVDDVFRLLIRRDTMDAS